MAVVAYFNFPGEPIENYDDGIERGGEAITNQPERRSHVCFETEDGWAVVDVWDSEEALAAFVEEMGFEQRGRPRIYQVHNLL